MSHAHHFLSRLDRVSLPHVELALGLYNDVPLLLFILDRARIPERAERVAISLDHPQDGPFLIVTRDGHFVTCLGAGMSPGEHPVITRGQLDAVAAKGGALRARMDETLRFAGARGGVGKLLRRIHEAGDELSREEIVALGGLQPLYALEFFHFLFAASKDVREARKLLLPHLRRSDRLKPQFRDGLRSYWNTLWSIGHFSVLSAMDGWASMERWPAEAASLVPTAAIAWPAVREGITALALKGVWAAGRIGKPLLAGCKQRYREACSPLILLEGGMSLGAIGLRHTRLHAEVAKVLAAGPDIDPAENLLNQFVHSLNGLLNKVVDPKTSTPSDITLMQRALGAGYWVKSSQHLPPGAPLRFERAEDVPEDLALCAALNGPFEYMTQPANAAAMFPMLPWLARATPEQLYLPREALKAISVPWEPEHTLLHLRRHRDYFLNQKPAVRPEGPSRQGPCPCGSGKKYKRCCGDGEGKKGQKGEKEDQPGADLAE